MCLTEEDKKKLKDSNTTNDDAWDIIREAIATCSWVVSDEPWFDGDLLIGISCSTCGVGFGGVCGSADVAFDNYLDLD